MNKVTLLSTLAVVGFFSVPALAGTPLNSEQIKQLVSGNTVDIQSKGIDYKGYYAADGATTTRNESNGKIYNGTWRVSDSGEICSLKLPGKESCGQVIDNGDGTYNRLDNGSPRGVWKKIYPGNTIAE